MSHAQSSTIRNTGAGRRGAFLFTFAAVAAALLTMALAGPASAYVAAGPGWYWQNPQPTAAQIWGLDFAGSSCGWAVGLSGAILKTTNGGASWAPQRSGTTKDLLAVSFLTTTSGWAVSRSGEILHTADGGTHWTLQHSGASQALRAVSFANARQGWVVGDGGLILATTNGGKTWKKQTSPVSGRLCAVACASGSRAWATGGDGDLLMTTDSGLHWTNHYVSGSTYDFSGLAFANAKQGWAIDSNGGVAITTNGGLTWQDDTPSPKVFTWGMNAIVTDGKRVWAVGANGAVMSRPVTAGGTWAVQADSGQAVLYAAAVRSAGHVLAAGDYGTFVRTSNSGATWTPGSKGFIAQLQYATFTDARHGWAVGKDEQSSIADIYATSNGGTTWKRQLSDDSMNWFGGVAFVNATNGWAVGWGGSITATTNGGGVWQTQVAPGWPAINYNAVACTNTMHAWAAGDGSAVANVNLKGTSDGGAHWYPIASGTTAQINDITFADAQRGWLVGDGGAISASSDYGVTWTAQTSTTNEDLHGVDFAGDLHGWAVGDNGTIVATSNGGTTWAAQTSNTTDELQSVAFVSATRGWAVSSNGAVLTTADGGTHWVAATSPTGVALYDVTGVDAKHAWAVGEFGTVLALDVVAPVAAATAPHAVQHKAVTVKITATDAQSGVARIQYRIGSGAWKTGAAAKVTRRGRTKVWFRATDVAGNVSKAKSATVRIAR